MAAKMRKQHFGIFVLQKLLIITVTNYAADCFIERSLMLWIAEAIDKNEICVSVPASLILSSLVFLPLCFASCPPPRCEWSGLSRGGQWKIVLTMMFVAP